MKKETKAKDRRGILLSLVIAGLVAALIILPNQFRSEAGSQKDNDKGLVQRTESHADGIENYDIREDVKNTEAVNLLENFRQKSSKDAAVVANIRDEFVQGENQLRSRIPTLQVEYNTDIRIPEVIGTDVYKSTVDRLTSPSNVKRSEILRNFIKQNDNLIGVSGSQADSLKTTADYTNPDGNLSYAVLEQTINGIPVFRGEIKAGFTRNGEMFRVINNLAPGLEYSSLSTDFRNPVNAVKAASAYMNLNANFVDLTRNDADSTDIKVVYGKGDFATTVEKMYFPTEPGVAVPAWRVLIWQPVSSYYVIVDAETGKMLWRKNITEDQTQAATYNVYTNPANMMNVAANPAPLTTGILDPGLGTQGSVIPRSSVTLIGNEGANSFNNKGWIADGNNTTDGNNVQAGLDRKSPNSGNPANPADIDPDGMAVGSPNRVFNFAYSPGDPSTNTGDSPLPSGQSAGSCLASSNTDLPTDYQKGITTQLFYINNRYHDELYKLGFTEAARNFQNDNFGRGGNANDRVSAQAQDCSGTDNANFSTPADGTRGTMQMYLFTGPTPNYDGSIDADIVIHEHTHGLSNRLVGNGSGLSTTRARSMGEGWSDFYGLALVSNPATPANAIHTTGSWATYLLTPTYNYNYYYGIRRFPYATLSTKGGPNNRPHNPMTLADVDPAQIDNSDGAFGRNPVFSNSATEVHNAGEVWAVALWEVRAQMIARLGGAAGNQRVLQLVTDGLKLTPNAPTFIKARDAIIAAAAASSLAPEASADVIDVREGFRIRGMGFGATDGGTAVVESFASPNVVLADPFTVSDSTGNNNGVPEPGEDVLLNVAVTNTTGSTITNVVANINGGANVSYGSVADGATVTKQIPFTIPADAACGSTITVTINISSSAGTQAPQTRSFTLGSPVGVVENFDGVTAPALPSGWTTTQDTGTAINWVTSTTSPSSAPNSAFANDPSGVNMSSLVSPSVAISSTSAQLKFKNKYATESTFDGMVLEMSVADGAFQDIIAAGGSFASGGYNSTISSNFQSPIGGRMAWSGISAGGYIDTVVNLPASANGKSVKFRWRMASDMSVGSTGVNIDDVQIISSFNCASVNPAPAKSRADFDGDGKTDLSVFRPSEGNWYLNRSTAGFSVISWGKMNDVAVPGDYDGDNEADTAIFRASNTVGTADFFILNSMTNTVSSVEWGAVNDVPVVADYDNDGKTDVAVYRPSTGTWFILNSNGGTTTTTYGLAGDVPVVGNFVGDDAADLTVYRNGTWYTRLPGGGSAIRTFGATGDILVPADYDGDNKDDLAVYRPSQGRWYVYNSSNGALTSTLWGISSDVPVPGDYDGDGKDDLAVYRNGTWYINGSTSGITIGNFGVSTDKPLPRSYIP